ncbi:MAG: histidinol-phosphate transaminase [Verrucomicrobiota bacterium]|jgi:histidinol-phosphate aminotransferase|nr:histidinol-phosphate transaminase [Verrucomicrobiota bacterium]
MKLIRKHLQQLQAYVPGEQSKGDGLVKLNTNENPSPPSPKVLEAVKAAVDGRLRLYPDPTAQKLREALAKMHGVTSGNVIVGNGSDELLSLATRAFVTPGKDAIQYYTPSYSLYPVLANIHDATRNEVALKEDFSLPVVAELRRGGWDFKAALTYVTTPNAPSGRGYATSKLETLCKAQKGVVVLDEAYVDFAEEHAMALVSKFSHVLVSRTFSKAYSLCFQRIGYFVGAARLISTLDKIRDSYNVNGLGQVAALATLRNLPFYRANFKRITHLREQVASALANIDFVVLPSQTNFLLVKPPILSARTWQRKLREHNVLVRWFSDLRVKDYLRITIGSEKEMSALMRSVKVILKR